MNKQAEHYTKMELTRRAGALGIRIDHLRLELESAVRERERIRRHLHYLERSEAASC
jgi:hypothetical protein